MSADNEGVHYEMRLQGVSVAGITANDILLGTGGTVEINFGTTFNDLLFGFELNDELHGGDGNDRIYGGGGVDKLYGDGGNDTIILDGAINFGGIYDGGSGTDTILMRDLPLASTTPAVYGPRTSYNLLPTAPGTGPEGST